MELSRVHVSSNWESKQIQSSKSVDGSVHVGSKFTG